MGVGEGVGSVKDAGLCCAPWGCLQIPLNFSPLQWLFTTALWDTLIVAAAKQLTQSTTVCGVEVTTPAVSSGALARKKLKTCVQRLSFTLWVICSRVYCTQGKEGSVLRWKSKGYELRVQTVQLNNLLTFWRGSSVGVPQCCEDSRLLCWAFSLLVENSWEWFICISAETGTPE